MTYRRTIDSDTWHWCSNCPGWPAGNHQLSPTAPYFGILCEECARRQREGSCQDEAGRARDGELPPSGHEHLSARELESIRNEMRKSGERVRGELERLESLIILARARESSLPVVVARPVPDPVGTAAAPRDPALVGFIAEQPEPAPPSPPPDGAPAPEAGAKGPEMLPG